MHFSSISHFLFWCLWQLLRDPDVAGGLWQHPDLNFEPSPMTHVSV